MVLPPSVTEAVMDVRRGTDVLTSTLLQATFAAFITSGDLDRHLRRVRRLYRHRRDALVAAVATHFSEATPTGVSAGLQTLLVLPSGWDEAAVAERAADAGVRVRALSEFRVGQRTELPPALVLGYGQLEPAAIERGVRLLAAAARTSVT
jgi:GntR family transcriptional regulator/MocR family aminotransferase